MADLLMAIDGTSFVLSDRRGDITGGILGLFVSDARYLSRWRLLLDGCRPQLLTSHHVEPFSALMFLMNGEGGKLPPNAVSIVRRRVVGGGMEEDIELTSHLRDEVSVDLRLEVAADMLDLFEVKARHFTNPGDHVFTDDGTVGPESQKGGDPGPEGTLLLERDVGGYRGRVVVGATMGPDVDAEGMTWHVRLPAQGSFRATVSVAVRINDVNVPQRHHLADVGVVRTPAGGPHAEGRAMPRVSSSWQELEATHRRGADDLLTLLIDEPDLASGLPAAGLPWFMTVFGRDTLVTAYQVLPGAPWLGWSAIETLARLQAVTDDPARDAQPGKIVHELRRGPVAINGGAFPYFGTVDAPMLFVVLVSELWRWSGDDERARRYRPNVEAVLRWMREDGDPDGDGFIEWARRAPGGLENQAWKDSWDAYRRHDGSLAPGPLASAEVQGYAFDALLRAAELAAGPWGDAQMAGLLRAEAQALSERFNDRFWSRGRGGYYHLALDGAKQPVNSITSNMGHLLWSGIVPADRAAVVTRQLMSPEMFSGWGVRTMSAGDRGFNPISYHCGTVWPHDNSILVAGLHRYGMHAEANRVMTAVIEAAGHFPDHRLPEVFAGYGRDLSPFPIGYPTASSPQAWACGSSMLMLRAALGLRPDPEHRTVTLDPHLPPFAERLEMTGLEAFGKEFGLRVESGKATLLNA